MSHNLNKSDYISPKWDAPSHWDEIYKQAQKKGKSTINRDPKYLLKSIEKLNELIREKTFMKYTLEAGLTFFEHHVDIIRLRSTQNANE